MEKTEMEKTRQRLAEFLKQRRKYLGISQTELSIKSGLGFRTIQRMEEANFWPGLKQFLSVCEALGCVFSLVPENGE